MTTAKKFWLIGLVILSLAGGLCAQSSAQAKPQKRPPKAGTPAATQEEVKALRDTVSTQQKEIEGLKTVVDRLTAAVHQLSAAGKQTQSAAEQAQAAASQAQRIGTDAGTAAASADQRAGQAQAAATEAKTAFLQKTEELQKKVSAVQVGWSGEHFFLKSADGSFLFQPYGYVQLDQRSYRGTNPPVNNFVLRRARFGFQGKLGKHYDFALLVDFADTGNVTPRDFYINANYHPAVQFQFGQFKEPFAQEEMAGAAYLDFVERSLASLLYPSPTTFRSPGAMIHGDLMGGVVQYWAGAFNGRGNLTNNTTNTPEGVLRLRFYPFKKSSNAWLKGLAFGGAGTKGRSLRPADRSLAALIPTRTFTFFNTDAINGGTVRANGEFTWVKGPMAVRAEYNQTNQNRTQITTAGAVSTTNLPGVVGKGYYVTATYLLTREDRPENGQPTPRHAFLEKDGHGIGAWELKFRYSNLQMEDGPRGATAQRNRVDQISSGINWYPTKFVRYMLDFNVERWKNPPVTLLPQTFVSILQRVQFRF